MVRSGTNTRSPYPRTPLFEPKPSAVRKSARLLAAPRLDIHAPRGLKVGQCLLEMPRVVICEIRLRKSFGILYTNHLTTLEGGGYLVPKGSGVDGFEVIPQLRSPSHVERMVYKRGAHTNRLLYPFT